MAPEHHTRVNTQRWGVGEKHDVGCTAFRLDLAETPTPDTDAVERVRHSFEPLPAGLGQGLVRMAHFQRPWSLVAPAGFEPAISALRGLRPRPLDDGAAIWWAALGLNQRPLACEASALPLS